MRGMCETERMSGVGTMGGVGVAGRAAAGDRVSIHARILVPSGSFRRPRVPLVDNRCLGRNG